MRLNYLWMNVNLKRLSKIRGVFIRCNVGVAPKYLVDQHLLAEMMEIPMVVGSLRYWKFQIKSPIPDRYDLGTGHMNFLKNKLLYLKRRHLEVSLEMDRRGFHNEKSKVDLTGIPEEFCCDWNPTLEDSNRLRFRLKWKLANKKNPFWRYNRKYLNDEELNKMIIDIENSELYYV
jgi:deoxyribonuclease (pyrimidine dimer)